MALTAIDAISDKFIAVEARSHPPKKIKSDDGFLVFDSTNNDWSLQGLVGSAHAAKFPTRIFADLLPRKTQPLDRIEESTSLTDVIKLFSQRNFSEACVINAEGKLLGVINRASLMKAQIIEQKENYRRLATERLDLGTKQLSVYRRDKLQALQSTFDNIGTMFINSSINKEYLKQFIDSIREIIDVKYAAMRITCQKFCFDEFIYSGINKSAAAKIEHWPQGLGIFDATDKLTSPVIIENIASHLTKMGISEHHPQMKSLLLSALKGEQTLYGHIYLADKVDGQAFNQEDEVLLQSFSQLISLLLSGLQAQNALVEVKQQLQQTTDFDTVTGLPSKSVNKEQFQLMLKSVKTQGSAIAFIMINIDDFNTLNNALGQTLGDLLLYLVASRLKDYGRIDAAITRISGDEFLVLVKNISVEHDLGAIARDYMSLFAEPFNIDTENYYISITVGVSLYPNDGQSYERLVKSASTALHHAKRRGKHQIQFYQSKMDSYIKRRLTIESSLKKAVRNNELMLCYQFQLDGRNNAICGVEALIRWRDQELGQMSPVEFIPVAEDSGLIADIGEWVMEVACKQRNLWLELGIREFPIAVNVSAMQISKGNLEQVVSQALTLSGLPASFLELEITENCSLEQPEALIQTLLKLKQSGVKLAIDDFGTGYSNLSLLEQMPLDKIKIDRSFITELTENERTKTIPYAIIDLAKGLGLSVIAEGVENQSQVELLKAHGCNYYQGFYYYKPMSAEDCTRLLISNNQP